MSAIPRASLFLAVFAASLNGQTPAENRDPLPPGVVARLGSARLRHPGSVCALTFARDGQTIYAGGADKVIHQWDVRTGKELRKFEEHTEEIRGLAVTPDGKKLLSVSLDGTLRAWELDKSDTDKLGKHDDCIEGLALSPDGKTAATVGRDHAVRLWNVADGDRLCILSGHENNVVCIAFSPDGKTLATGSWDKTIRLWDVPTQKPGAILTGHTGYVEALAFAPDGKSIASGGKDGSIRLWDSTTGKEQRRMGAGLSRVWALAFTRDSKLLLAGGQAVMGKEDPATLRAFDAATGRQVWQQSAHSSRWKAEGDTLFATPLGGAGCIVLSPDGKTAATGGADGRIRLWEPATGRDLRPVVGHQDAVTGVVFLKGAQTVLTAGLDGTLRWWETKTGQETQNVATTPAQLFAVSPDRKIVVATGAGNVTVHDEAGKKLHEWRLKDGPIRCLALAPEGTFLALGGAKGKLMLTSLDGKEARKLAGLEEAVQTVVISPDGKQVAAASRNEPIHRWDAVTGKPLPPLADRPRDVTCLGYSPNGRYLAAGFGGSRSVLLWDAVSGANVIEFAAEGSSTLALVFSPDGQTIFTSHEDHGVRLWEVRTGKIRREVPAHHAPLTALGLSLDGRLLAMASADQTVLLLNRWHSPELNNTRLTGPRLLELWTNLASEDAGRAYDAMCLLAAFPEQGLSMLRPRLTPLPKLESAQIAKWIASLDARSFKVREEAMETLGRLGRLVEEPLKAALEGKTSLDQRRRIEELLKRMTVAGPVEEWQRLGRAIEVVEQIGGEPAIELLKKMTEGGDFRPTREAQAALERLRRR